MAPLFDETDAPLLKTFLMKRLESASEADPDVLSDYILALLRHDQPPEEVMQTCITQLADFMTTDSTAFVKDVFAALSTKSYVKLIRETRKRSFDTASASPAPPYPNKFQRQSYPQPQPYPYAAPVVPPQPIQQWPGVPPSRYAPWPGQGPPPPGWNSNPIPVNVPIPPPQWPPQPGRPKVPRIKGTCFDFLEKGFCLRGATCPYDHGVAPAVVSPSGELEGTDPYDPLRPNNNVPETLPVIPRPPPAIVTPRPEIHKGPNHADKSNTTLVVEGIPQDKFNEPTIREWFGQFGPLKEVIVDQSWGKAILVYADHESATKAWNDPRPIFENRFVKIWWKKSEPAEPVDKLSSGIVDQVELEIAREAARKAQKEHEEKQQRKQELEKKKEELEKQRLELVEKQKMERERLMERIKRAEEKAKEKAKGVVNSATMTAAAQKSESATPAAESPASGNSVNGEVPKEGENVEEKSRKAQLQKMLSDLQLQAKAMNIPPSEYAIPPLSDSRTRPTFRGSHRGRPYVARGGRGRGRGGSSRSLDLRPKSVFMPSIAGTDKETSIREWLIVNSGDAVCETAPEDPTGIVVKFKERYEAEEFITKLKGPPLGPLTGNWYTPVASKPVQNNTTTEETGSEVEGFDKDYVYDYEEDAENGDSEGRWKR